MSISKISISKENTNVSQV